MSQPKQPTKQPSKEDVRDWLKRELAEQRPPPDVKQIRRELGWDLLQTRRQPRPERND